MQNPVQSNAYGACTHYLKSLAAQEIRSGNYPNLRSTYPKGSRKLETVEWGNLRMKVSLLFRSASLPHEGKRNLSVGNLESVIVVRALLKDEEDYLKGVDIEEKWGVRVVTGDYINRGRYFREIGANLISDHSAQIAQQLSGGDYTSFVKTMMGVSDETLARVKGIFLHSPYPSKTLP